MFEQDYNALYESEKEEFRSLKHVFFASFAATFKHPNLVGDVGAHNGNNPTQHVG